MERSEDISFSKTKSKDLQERITEEMAQEEMKWRLMPQEVEEKRNELTLAPIERQKKKSLCKIFAKTSSQAENWRETTRSWSRFEKAGTGGPEFEQHMWELEEKNDGWKEKVMQLEKNK